MSRTLWFSPSLLLVLGSLAGACGGSDFAGVGGGASTNTSSGASSSTSSASSASSGSTSSSTSTSSTSSTSSSSSGAGGAGGGASSSSSSSGAGGSNPATDPVVKINHPGNGECRVVGVAFPVIGVAIDPQDGDISAALAWSDSLEGNIGSGASFQFAPAVTGMHTITASVKDSNANPGSAQITINIKASCP